MTQDDNSRQTDLTEKPLNPIEESAVLQAYWRAQSDLGDTIAERVIKELITPEMAAKYHADRTVYAAMHVASVRAADKALTSWADSREAPAIVLLGGGLDGRCDRLSPPQGTTFYNIDSSAILARYSAVTAEAPFETVAVPASLTKPVELFSALCSAGWNSTRPTAFVVEGVFEFTGLVRMRALLTALADHAETGTLILLQALNPSLVAYAKAIGDEGFPWRTLPDPRALLEEIRGIAFTELPSNSPVWRSTTGEVPLSHVYSFTL